VRPAPPFSVSIASARPAGRWMELGAGVQSIWRPEVSRSFNPAAHGGNRRGDVVRRVPAPGFGARRRRESSIGAVAAAMAGPAANICDFCR